jgi:hypothetical protein
MLKKLPLNPVRPLRVFTLQPPIEKGIFLAALRNISGKALFAPNVPGFTIFFNHQ